jgi:hypothetical protein
VWRIFGPKNKEVTREWRNLRKEEIQNFCAPYFTIKNAECEENMKKTEFWSINVNHFINLDMKRCY